MRRRIAAGGVGLLLALTIGVGVGFAGSSSSLPAGVSIDGVDVGGMSPTEAERALTERSAKVARQPVIFVSGDDRFTVVPADAGVAADWDVAIAAAQEKGDGFFLLRGFKRLVLRFQGADIAATAATNRDAVERQLDRFAAKIEQPARDAAIVLDGLTPVVMPAQTGVQLDRERAAAIVTQALTGLSRRAAVQLPVSIAQPAVRANELDGAVAQVRTALSGPLRLTLRKKSFTVEPEELATYLVMPADGKATVTLGGKAFDKYLADLAASVDRKPANADLELTAGGRPKVVPAREGRKLDIAKARAALLAAAFTAAATGRVVELPVATAQPKLSTAEARALGVREVVATYTTVYGGDTNRLHNVRLVAELIDDHLIAPGDTFSFNETTGERNADKGFREAPVIINGELKTGLGGGVCQVSTTVFNAAYEAGLPIGARTNHALYISHYPTGRDATVNFPDTDLTFTNDTGHWLWVRAFVGSSELTVTLYGTDNGRTVESVQAPMTIGKKIPVKRVPESDLYVGDKWLEASGTPTRDVSVRRIVRDANGDVVFDTVFYSHYVAEPRIVHVGTKKKPKEQQPDKGAGAPGGGGAGAGAGGGATDGGGASEGTTGGGATDGTTGGGTGGGTTDGGNAGGDGGTPPPPPAA